MAASTTDGPEQDSSVCCNQKETVNNDEKTEGLRASDQEPGDSETVKMDVSSEHEAVGNDNRPLSIPEVDKETPFTDEATKEDNGLVDEMDLKPVESEKSPEQKSPDSGDFPGDGTPELREEQRENVSSLSKSSKSKGDDFSDKTDNGIKKRTSVEMSSSDGEPLSRMDSEDSINSTLMDMESAASSGRSTPAMMNGQGGASSSSAKASSYACCWDQCHQIFSTSPDLAEHIRGVHVDGQRGGVFVCLWKGCKVYNTPSTSQSWLQRHMLSHSGDKPFKCVVGGCNATFASQGGLARHVPTHFSQQNSSKMSSQARLKEESPSKAGLNKKRKQRIKRRRSLPRPHDFFDAQTMDAIRHRAICLNLATHIESQGKGHSVVFHSTVIARRKEDSGKVKVLLHWTPEDILPDAWVSESDRPQMKTKVVHLSQLPQDTAVLLDPNIYRMFF
ncbi:zinc finger protein AEBP2 [Chanos chanos]|uniref:Zinc finger protein AEBP2 n=1 Tax=Chanos chanos TaxID=29144 RepID=A0A6J2VP58_CHACN|nr:zinc finger protein AEBP2-like [Chanos chanos]